MSGGVMRTCEAMAQRLEMTMVSFLSAIRSREEDSGRKTKPLSDLMAHLLFEDDSTFADVEHQSNLRSPKMRLAQRSTRRFGMESYPNADGVSQGL